MGYACKSGIQCARSALLPEASGSLAQIFADIFGGPQGSQTERKESFLLVTSARIESLGPEKPNVA